MRILFWRYIYIILQWYKVIKSHKKVVIKVFLHLCAHRWKDPDRYKKITDPEADPGGPKTHGSSGCGSGFGTFIPTLQNFKPLGILTIRNFEPYEYCNIVVLHGSERMAKVPTKDIFTAPVPMQQRRRIYGFILFYIYSTGTHAVLKSWNWSGLMLSELWGTTSRDVGAGSISEPNCHTLLAESFCSVKYVFCYMIFVHICNHGGIFKVM